MKETEKSKIAKLLGKAGGEATKRKHGKEHYSAMAKKSHAPGARRERAK